MFYHKKKAKASTRRSVVECSPEDYTRKHCIEGKDIDCIAYLRFYVLEYSIFAVAGTDDVRCARRQRATIRMRNAVSENESSRAQMTRITHDQVAVLEMRYARRKTLHGIKALLRASWNANLNVNVI